MSASVSAIAVGNGSLGLGNVTVKEGDAATFTVRLSSTTQAPATYALTYAVNIALYKWSFEFLDNDLTWPSSWALVAAFIIAQGTATLINFCVQRWVIFRSTRKNFVVD